MMALPPPHPQCPLVTKFMVFLCPYWGTNFKIRMKMYSLCKELKYLTNRFHFAVRLYSDNAQMTSRTKKYATSRRRIAWLMFSPRFDVLCALSEYRCTAKWNLFVLYIVWIWARTKYWKCFRKSLCWPFARGLRGKTRFLLRHLWSIQREDAYWLI